MITEIGPNSSDRNKLAVVTAIALGRMELVQGIRVSFTPPGEDQIQGIIDGFGGGKESVMILSEDPPNYLLPLNEFIGLLSPEELLNVIGPTT